MASNPRGTLVQLEWLIDIGSFSLVKKEKKTQSQPNNFESNHTMVKQKIVIEVLKHAESKSGLYLGYLCLCRRFLSFCVRGHDCFRQFLSVYWNMTSFSLKQINQVFQNTRPCCYRSDMHSILHYFWKSSRKKNKQWFWDQSVILRIGLSIEVKLPQHGVVIICLDLI